jgi:hypothetical protein
MKIDLHIKELVREASPRETATASVAPSSVSWCGSLPKMVFRKALPGGGEIAKLDGGSFEMKPGGRAEAVGGQVANCVYGGLKR